MLSDIFPAVHLRPFFHYYAFLSGIDIDLTDSRERTALEILREHPAPKSQQITALIQGKMEVHVVIPHFPAKGPFCVETRRIGGACLLHFS